MIHFLLFLTFHLLLTQRGILLTSLHLNISCPIIPVTQSSGPIFVLTLLTPLAALDRMDDFLLQGLLSWLPQYCPPSFRPTFVAGSSSSRLLSFGAPGVQSQSLFCTLLR